MTTPAIDIRGLVKTYGSLRALDGVDLTVAPGEFFALLGPNGAGKTTLISILAGLVRPTAGSVRVMGVDVVGDGPEARRQLGVVPQELVFDPFFTVRETLRIQSGYFGLLRNDDWIDELLAALELTDKADTNMRRLSGGMKRRVLVGQALVHRPPVIVLDEPTAGVDVALRQGLWALMRGLNAEGHTIVLTTHYLEEAEELCGRVAMLKQGSLAALAPTQQLLARYAQRQVWLRLSDADRLPAGLASRFTSADGGWLADLADIGALEPLLAAVRQSGAGLEDLELRRADLEQVFLHLTESA
ncbi:MAG: ABC transporter ATP-binding protein [Betaproteobacteria bacterium]|nr:ABC transporter ATP-binding protein [Betaproteobacteria bacterium]NBT05660.1 ABC transporter ATP-binding protein [Betaproteobacteria bacterium]NBU12204.1 ABC transporter ATP-binding protein [Betaproteobacteria bacterium]NBY52496.1 ABC transporter ATP-binding protein [Betaproteobacteria bacterium]NCA23632.1 ABC transporter ATP-binding protein [Betaproteobacteria bacterium]